MHMYTFVVSTTLALLASQLSQWQLLSLGHLSLSHILDIYHQKYEDLQAVETDYKVDSTNLNIIAEIL